MKEIFEIKIKYLNITFLEECGNNFRKAIEEEAVHYGNQFCQYMSVVGILISHQRIQKGN